MIRIDAEQFYFTHHANERAWRRCIRRHEIVLALETGLIEEGKNGCIKYVRRRVVVITSFASRHEQDIATVYKEKKRDNKNKDTCN